MCVIKPQIYDLGYMKSLLINIFSEYKDQYDNLFDDHRSINSFNIIWSNNFLEWRPLYAYLELHISKIRIYKKKPSQLEGKYMTKVDPNISNRPFFSCLFGNEELLETQFFIFNKFNINDMIILHYKLYKDIMKLQKVEMNIYDLNTIYDVKYSYSYGLYTKDYSNRNYNETELYEKFTKKEYFYENNKVTKMITSGDEIKYYYVNYKGKEINFIGISDYDVSDQLKK